MDCKFTSRQIEAESYLLKLSQMEKLISAKEKELDALRYKASGAGAIRYDKDRVQSSANNFLEMAMDDIVKLSKEIEDDKQTFERMKATAYSIVRRMSNHEEKALLEWFYFHNVSIKDLSVKMHLSIRSAYYLRNNALESFGLLLH